MGFTLHILHPPLLATGVSERIALLELRAGCWSHQNWLDPLSSLRASHLLVVQHAGYLAMEGVPKQAAGVRADTCLALPELDGAAVTAEEEEDDGAALGNAAANVHLYDYHIAYHPSYSVPFLLFRGRSRTGEILERKTLWTLATMCSPPIQCTGI